MLEIENDPEFIKKTEEISEIRISQLKWLAVDAIATLIYCFFTLAFLIWCVIHYHEISSFVFASSIIFYIIMLTRDQCLRKSSMYGEKIDELYIESIQIITSKYRGKT